MEGAGPFPAPRIAPLLGSWFNCDTATGEILRLDLLERDGGLALRAFGADEPGPVDWGEAPAVPHVQALGSREVTGFTAHYDFGFMETRIAANVKYGVLVIQSYNHFRDDSERPCYFTREFFHQLVDRSSVPTPGADGLPARMAADLPATGAAPGARGGRRARVAPRALAQHLPELEGDRRCRPLRGGGAALRRGDRRPGCRPVGPGPRDPARGPRLGIGAGRLPRPLRLRLLRAGPLGQRGQGAADHRLVPDVPRRERPVPLLHPRVLLSRRAAVLNGGGVGDEGKAQRTESRIQRPDYRIFLI